MENKGSTKPIKTTTIEVGVWGKVTYQHSDLLDGVTVGPQWGSYRPSETSKTSKFSKFKKPKNLIKLSEGIEFDNFKESNSGTSSYSFVTY